MGQPSCLTTEPFLFTQRNRERRFLSHSKPENCSYILFRGRPPFFRYQYGFLMECFWCSRVKVNDSETQ